MQGAKDWLDFQGGVFWLPLGKAVATNPPNCRQGTSSLQSLKRPSAFTSKGPA